jgi:hypothetical protein
MSFCKQIPLGSAATPRSLNRESTLEDAMAVFSSVKVELTCQINMLTSLKKQVTNSEMAEPSIKSKLRITIESLLIDLNEEMYELSEELANSYTPERQEAYVLKAREFDFRKKKLLKRIQTQIDLNPGIKIVRRENNIISKRSAN